MRAARAIAASGLIAIAIAAATISAQPTYQPSSYGRLQYTSAQAWNPPAGVSWDETGLGGGGQIHGSAIHPSNRAAMVLGTDNAGAFRSGDAGASWRRDNRGLADEGYDQFNLYGDDVLAFSRAGEDWFYMATHAGIYARQVAGDTWTGLTPVTDIYWCENPSGGWKETLSFSSLDYDGADLVVAGAGRVRILGETSSTYEPNSYPVSSTPDGVGGKYSVFRYIFGDPSGEKFRPWLAIGNVSAVRDISCAIVGGDTLVAMATRTGVFLYDGTKVVDLTPIDVYRGGSKAGNFTVNVAAAHLPYGIHLTERGAIYVAIDLRNTTDPVHSGIYKLHDATDPTAHFWQWVGDETPGQWFNNTSMWNNAKGLGGDDSQYPFVAVLEGAGADPDTVYAVCFVSGSWPFRPSLVRTYSPSAEVHQTEVWAGCIWDDGNSEFQQGAGGAPEGGRGWLTRGNNLNWSAYGRCAPAILPGGLLLYQPQARLFVSEDYGASWRNVYCKENGSNPNYWRSRGYVQSTVKAGGLAIFPEDNSLLWSIGDHGLSRSLPGWRYWRKQNPPIEPTTQHTEGFVWSTATSGLDVTADWRGTGRPAAVYVSGNNNKPSKPFRLMVYWDTDGNGTEEYQELTINMRQAQRWLWVAPAIVGNEVFATYVKYTDDIPNPASIDSIGVMRFTYDGAQWRTNNYDNGLPVTVTAQAQRLIYENGRLFLGMDHTSDTAAGGVWRCDPTVAHPGAWERITGFGTTFGAAQARSVQALDAKNDWLLVGSIGSAGNSDGAYWLSFNNAAATPSFTQIFNSGAGNLLGGLSVNPVYAERGWTTDLLCNERMCAAMLAFIDFDSAEFWLGIGAHERFWGENGGIWFYDGSYPAVNVTDGLGFNWGDARAAVKLGNRMAFGFADFSGVLIREQY